MPDRTPGLRERLRDDLRAAIDDAGRHQVTIAADLGVTTKHLCAMLTGRANLTLEWAERIAGACGRELVVALVEPDAVLPVVEAETAALRDTIERIRELTEQPYGAVYDLAADIRAEITQPKETP